MFPKIITFEAFWKKFFSFSNEDSEKIVSRLKEGKNLRIITKNRYPWFKGTGEYWDSFFEMEEE
jgi:hypothetical protein